MMQHKSFSLAGIPLPIFGLFAIALFMPTFKFLVPAAIVFTLLTWLLFFPKTFNRRYFFYALPLLVLYIIYAIGLLYTDDMARGTFDLEVKSSFLILPLFFIFSDKRLSDFVPVIFLIFISAAILNGCYGLITGFFYWYRENDPAIFFSQGMSGIIHPTYYAVYLCLGIAIIYKHVFDPFLFGNKKRIGLSVFLIIIQSVLVFFAASKGGLLAFVLLHILVFIFLAVRYKKVMLVLGIFIILAALSLWLISESVILRTKIEYAYTAWNKPIQEVYEEHRTTTESSMIRVLIWDNCKEAIAEHPFGVGTGDVQGELLKRYQIKGMDGAFRDKLNCHSQYFQTTLAVGYQGLVVLILTLLTPLILAFKKKDFLLLSFSLIYICNFPFESMLEAQAGVTHFVLFHCLITFFILNRKEINT